MKQEAELIIEAKALCRKFVKKVESGRARSKETYAECKAFLANFQTTEIDSCYECGEKTDDGSCENKLCKKFGTFAIF